MVVASLMGLPKRNARKRFGGFSADQTPVAKAVQPAMPAAATMRRMAPQTKKLRSRSLQRALQKAAWMSLKMKALTAEAERLSGRDDAAAQAFRALAEREDSRFLGLRGLLRQAMARGEWDAALALAREAEAAQPGAAAIHRSLLHGRLSHRAHRPYGRDAAQARAPRRGRLIP